VKILVVADREERSLWDFWTKTTAERMSDVSLILSAGDLDADYLEFLVTMLNVPLVYVRGNHDTGYEEKAPGGCIDADGIPVTVECHDRSSDDPEGSVRSVRILGLGGSMRYNPNASDMYTENEMRARVRRAEFRLRTDRFRGAGEGFDILLTHAPCKGYGDLDDLPHTGFECFNEILDRYHPSFHVYGHVHEEYIGGSPGGDRGYWRRLGHPSGTELINASGHYIIEI